MTGAAQGEPCGTDADKQHTKLPYHAYVNIFGRARRFAAVGLFAAPFGRCYVRAYAIRPYCAPASRQLLSLTLEMYAELPAQ